MKNKKLEKKHFSCSERRGEESLNDIDFLYSLLEILSERLDIVVQDDIFINLLNFLQTKSIIDQSCWVCRCRCEYTIFNSVYTSSHLCLH